MEYTSRMLLFIIIGCIIVTVTECQKSQLLALSETRKTGLEGTLLQVNCTAHVTSPLDSLKWIAGHDGQSEIQQAYLTNTTVVMTIYPLHGSDAGRYKCLLVMADGREEVAEFELMVRRKDTYSAACSITQFKCRKTKHCIFLRYRCDGKDDCGDGSDEDCESNPCLNKFRCNNTRCVDNQDVCNHVDNCGDLSDEGPSCFLSKFMSTTQPSSEDSQFGWLKITMSTVIASTVGVVILISFIVIVVFRVKMKRLREQRIARALDSMYRHGESREATSSGQGDEAPSDQHPFLPSGLHHYGNIIVNVNNGVQYLPGYDYSLFLAVPPPYSECSGGDPKLQPPPYSTIDRNNTHQHTCVTAHTDRQNISVSSVQNCLGGIRGTDHTGTVLQENIDRNSCTGGHICQSGTQAQDLSGITSSFLQSLLGSHSEDTSAVSVDRNTNCQSLSEPGRSCGHQIRAGSESLSDMPSNKSMSRPTSGATFNTAQNKSLIPNHVSAADDIVEHKQDTNRSCTTSLQAEHLNTHALRTSFSCAAAPDMSVIVHQIPDCGALTHPVISHADIHPNVSKDHELSNNSSFTQSHKLSDCDGTLLASSHTQGCDCPAEDSTCLIQHSDHHVDNDSELLLPLLPTRRDSSCDVFVNENNKCRPGHLSVKNGQIVLHTNESILAGNSTVPSSANSNTSLACSHDRHAVDGIKHENSVLPPVCQSHKDNTVTSLPVNGDQVSKNMTSSTIQSSATHNISDDTGSPPQSSSNLSPHFCPEASISQPAHFYSVENKSRFSGELSVKDGCLVLEAPKHTPFSQILTHLQETYAAEQRDNAEEIVEPVVNTKRPAGVVIRPSLPKFNSDFVLPYRNQPL